MPSEQQALGGLDLDWGRDYVKLMGPGKLHEEGTWTIFWGISQVWIRTMKKKEYSNEELNDKDIEAGMEGG